jgi:hypothetical protein
MEERPSLLRTLRRLDALALAVCAGAIVATSASATVPVAVPATDPSATGADLAWQKPGVGGFLRRDSVTTQLPGQDPALGGPYIAWRQGDHVTVAQSDTMTPVLELAIPGVQKLAISAGWLVYRFARRDGGAVLGARSLQPAPVNRFIAAVKWPAQLGRPTISSDTVVFHVAKARESAIVSLDLATGRRHVLRHATGAQLLNPAVAGSELLYVRDSRCSQEVRLGAVGGGRERVLLRLPGLARRDRGHERGHTEAGAEPGRCPRGLGARTNIMLWTTALSADAAYVTLLHPRPGGSTTPSLVQLRR